MTGVQTCALPIFKVKVVWSKEKKEVRAANLLELYQVGRRVVHSRKLTALEQQMASFPKSKDDLVDAVGSVVLRLLGPRLPKEETWFPR